LRQTFLLIRSARLRAVATPTDRDQPTFKIFNINVDDTDGARGLSDAGARD
jgi:hypothetical protein